MRFGQQLLELVDPKFRNYTVAYDNLKGYLQVADNHSKTCVQTIRDVTSESIAFLPAAHVEEGPSVIFQEALNSELAKVNSFADAEEKALIGQLLDLLKTMQETPRDAFDHIDSMHANLDQIADDIIAFDVYIRLNHVAFRKITKKEAEVHKTSSAAWFMANVTRAPFMTVDFDRLVTLLCACYSLTRSPSPVRHTSLSPLSRLMSGWVSNETLLEVKVALAKYADLTSCSVSSDNSEGFNRMVSEYYDTVSLDVCRRRDCGFQVDISEAGAVQVTLPSGNAFCITESQWTALWDQLTSEVTTVGSPVDPSYMYELSELVSLGVKQLVRCEYRRFIFATGSVEVFVDEGAVFLDPVTHEQLADSGRFSKFPSNVIYIHLAALGGGELPEWLTEITGMAGVTEVPSFSKRGHGLLLKYFSQSQEINLAGYLPAWFAGGQSVVIVPRIAIDNRETIAPSPLLVGIGQGDSTSVDTHTGSPPAMHIRALWGNCVEKVRQLLNRNHSEIEIQLKDTMVKIEPKSFFSCERNLLDWMHTCVVLTAVGVLVSRRVRLVGELVALMAIVILLAQVYLFRKRNRQMIQKEGTDFGDIVGPPMLFAAILLLSVDLFLDSLTSIFRN